MQMMNSHATFQGLQETRIKALLEEPCFGINTSEVKAFFNQSSKVWTHAFKLFTLITHRCHVGGPGFTVKSVKSRSGTWHNGLNTPLSALNLERRTHGVPHRCHHVECPGCGGVTPGTNRRVTAFTCDGVEVRTLFVVELAALPT